VQARDDGRRAHVHGDSQKRSVVGACDDGIEAVARYAALVNERSDDIGARRLHTVMEKMLETVSFDAPDLPATPITVDEKFVRERLEDLVQDEDLSRFIL